MSSGAPSAKGNEETTNPTMLVKANPVMSASNKRTHSQSVMASGSSPKRKKAKDMPRRPLSAYNIYFQEERKRTIAKHERGERQDDFRLSEGRDPSEALFQAVSRTVANRWKALPEDQREPYQARAKAEMIKYREKMDEYNQKLINSSSLARRLATKQKEQVNGSEGGGKTAGKEDEKPVGIHQDQTVMDMNSPAADKDDQQDAVLGSVFSLRPNVNASGGQSQAGPSAAAGSSQNPQQVSTAQSFGLPDYPAALGMTPLEWLRFLQSLNMGGVGLYSRMALDPAVSTMYSAPGWHDSILAARARLEQARLNQLLMGGIPSNGRFSDPFRGLYAPANTWNTTGLGVGALHGISVQQHDDRSAIPPTIDHLHVQRGRVDEAAMRATTQRRVSHSDELALQQLLRDHPDLARSQFGNGS